VVVVVDIAWNRKLSRSPAHRQALLRNLVNSVVKHGRIRTTVPKAKELQRLAEKAVTLAKRGDRNARTSAQGMIYEKAVLDKLFRELPTRMAGRSGGYTRIVRLGRRVGDNAEMCYVGFVDVLPSRHEIEQRALDEKVRNTPPAEGKEHAVDDLFLLSSPAQ
jgi:large subunit ribosomal protein L17